MLDTYLDMYNVNVEEALTLEKAAPVAKSSLITFRTAAILLALLGGSATRRNRFIWWTAQGRYIADNGNESLGQQFDPAAQSGRIALISATYRTIREHRSLQPNIG